MWSPVGNGATIGERGSEEGLIRRDEEHPAGMRITLESDGATAPFAITCGIYGVMVHTCFFSDDPKAQAAFSEMKVGLETLVAQLPESTESDADRRVATVAVQAFLDKLP